jgi:hypothetical protein
MRIDNAALRRRIVMLVQEIGRDVERVEGATMDYTKLTLAELRNGISDTDQPPLSGPGGMLV